jgi:hypothetical protein
MRATITITLLCAVVVTDATAQETLGPRVSVAAFTELDEDNTLSVFTDSDRLSKALIRASGQRDAGVSIALLDQVLQTALNSDEGHRRICEDLNRGDSALVDAMVNVLSLYNIRADQARALLDKWARQGPDDYFRGIMSGSLSRPEGREALRRYYMEVDADWTRLVATTFDIVTSDSDWNRALRQALINTLGNTPNVADEILRRAAESPSGRWKLMPLAKRLVDAKGAIGRALVSPTIAPPASYTQVWKAVSATIAGDPRLLRDFRDRMLTISGIRADVDGLLIPAMRADAEEAKSAPEDSFLAGIVRAAEDPASRAGAAFQQLVPKEKHPGAYVGSSDVADSRGISTFATALVRSVENSEGWRSWVLWYLTRPAEVVASATRNAIGVALANTPALAEEMIQKSPLFSNEFEPALAAAGGYSFYDEPATLYTKVAEGEVAPEALMRYSNAVAAVLSANEVLWAAAMKGAKERPDGIVRKLVTATIESAPETAAVWARTCVVNDSVLGNAFIGWLVKEGKAPNRNTAIAWLSALSNAVAENKIVGNVDLARFKSFFCEFAATPEGWPLVWRRLAIESISVPSALRSDLVQQALKEPDLFWKLHGRLCAIESPMTRAIRAKTIYVLNNTDVDTMLLDEVALQNPAAADAVSAVWESLLDQESPVMTTYAAAMSEGVVRSTWFVYGTAILGRLLDDPQLWDLCSAAAKADLDVNSPEQARRVLLADKEKAVRFVRDVLSYPDVLSAWAEEVKYGVLFDNRADIMAGFIKSRQECMIEWKKAIAQLVLRDPGIARVFVEALQARRTGDQQWNGAVSDLRAKIARVVVDDRVFFEQLLAYPTQTFAESLEALADSKLGSYNGTWFTVPSSSL